ncbi:MAG: hypothetical protein ACT4P6_17965 [Gemmatimonadaceae bacterium]
MADVGLADSPVYREDAPVTEDAKHGIYRDLIAAARFFAERARGVEESALQGAGQGDRAPGSAAVRHRAYVTGSILSSVAFLDASINELYLELHGARTRERTRLPRRVAAVLGRFWSHVENAPVLQRYQVVLAVADAERFDERRTPFQDADSLMKLRDALVHCRPERPESRRRVRALEQRLHARFSENPLASADSPWFPDICLSTACAEWTVHTVDAFSDEFCRRMSLPPRGLERKDVDARNGAGTGRSLPGTRNGRSAASAAPNESHTRHER